MRSAVKRGLAWVLALAAMAALSPAWALEPPPAPGMTDPGIIAAFGGEKAVTRPSRDAVMGFSLPTQIMSVSVRGGQDVTKGTVLMRGDDAEDIEVLELQKIRAGSDATVIAAKAAMDLADLEYRRVGEIFAKGGSSQQEVDRARLTLDRTRADWEAAKVTQLQEINQVKRLQARLDKMRLEAPFDGQVDIVMVDVGQAVTENEKVVRVVNVDLLWMDVPAPMNDAVTLGLKNGDKAWILLDSAAGSRVTEGRVIEVAPTTDLASRSRRVRVEMDNPRGPRRVLAGEPAWVRFTPPPADVMSRLTAQAAAAEAGATTQANK